MKELETGYYYSADSTTWADAAADLAIYCIGIQMKMSFTKFTWAALTEEMMSLIITSGFPKRIN